MIGDMNRQDMHHARDKRNACKILVGELKGEMLTWIGREYPSGPRHKI